MVKFNLITLFLLFSLIVSPIADAQSAYDFNPEIKSQDFFDVVQQSLQSSSGELFTTAGEQLKCSEKPTAYGTGQASGYIATGQFQDISCGGGGDALVNWYHIYSTGKWDFQGELRVSPSLGINSVRLNANGGYPIGWECYRCEKISAQCTSGQSRCFSYNSVQSCVNGKWSTEQICPTKQLCNLQGKCSTTCEEKILITDWSACVNGKQIRTTYDARACGVYQSKTETQSCTSPSPVVTPPIVSKAIGISFSQLGTLTDSDLVKSFCNNDAECSAGVCIRKEAVGLAAIFSTETIRQFVEDIKNIFGDATEQRIDNLLEQSDKTGICLTDYTPGLDVSKGTVPITPLSQISKAATLLEEELEDPLLTPTEAEIKDALCTRTTECSSVEGYRVRCVGTAVIEEEFDIEIPTLTAFEKLIDGRFGEEGEGGVCVASKEGTGDFLKMFEGLGKAVGASGSNAGAVGIGIVIAGLLILMMLFSGQRR